MIERIKLPTAAPAWMGAAPAWLVATLALAGLSACVTINIYFPAAAAEKAADKIIDEVWQLKDGAKNGATNAPQDKPAAPAPQQ